MSLFKQLLILISGLFLLIFCINFILSINNIKDYLEGEAKIHAQDTATSLGMSLSPYMNNSSDPVIKTMMNAIFDRGYYQEIKLLDTENRSLVVLKNKHEIKGVPDWFVQYISMQSTTAKSEISTGWNMRGTIYVTINPGTAYLKLYQQVKTGFYYSLLGLMFAIGLLFIVLRITLASLNKIEAMAIGITQGQFNQIHPLPWTRELKHVTYSMNMMAEKIATIINNLNTKLEAVGKKLQQDDLTGLNNKSCFEHDIKQLTLLNEEVEAFVFMIKIDGLSSLVKTFGNKSIEQFLQDFARLLKDIDRTDRENLSAYRFFAAEFVLLAQSINQQQAEQIAKQLSTNFTQLGKKYQKKDIAHIGLTPFNRQSSSESILSAADEAYQQAQLIGENGYYIRTGAEQAKDIEEWKDFVFNIIDNQTYQVSYLGQIISCQNNDVLMEEAFSQMIDAGDQISTGIFISVAEKFAKIIELDKGVISKTVNHIHSNHISYPIAISLSTRTIKNADFRVWLSQLIKKNQSISAQLVFNLSAYAVAKEISVYQEFISFIHQLNGKVMIKRFEAQSLTSAQIKQLKPDYIRLARDLGQGISHNEEKKLFVKTIKEIADLLDIYIFAENIKLDSDYICIRAMGITGASH